MLTDVFIFIMTQIEYIVFVNQIEYIFFYISCLKHAYQENVTRKRVTLLLNRIK